MSKEIEVEYPVEDYEPVFNLLPGFYLVDENRNVKTKDVTRGKPGTERTIVTEPIRCRTIAGAKDVVAAAGTPLAILCVTEGSVPWPVA